MTLHFQLAKYNKSKVLNFKLCPVADRESLKKYTHTIIHIQREQDYGFLSMTDGAQGATYKHLIKNQVQLVTLRNRE